MNYQKSKKISWMVTGAMNASLDSKDGCVSFSPDPWTSKENAYPEELKFWNFQDMFL